MTVRVSFMGTTPCDALAMEEIESNTSSHCFTLDRQAGFDPSLEASLHVRHVETRSLQNARGDGGSSAALPLPNAGASRLRRGVGSWPFSGVPFLFDGD